MSACAQTEWCKSHLTIVEGVALTPQLHGSSKTKYIFESTKTDFPYSHFQHGTSFNTVNIRPWLESRKVECVVNEPVLFGGPLLLNFSHLLAEGIHRIWPRMIFPELSKAPVVFLGREKHESVLPQWAIDIFRLLGLKLDDIRIVEQPTLFERLYVPHQARIMPAITQMPDYAKLFPVAPEIISSGPNFPKRIYLSRRKHAYSGCFLGETYLERTLHDNADFTIVYPEEIDVISLVGMIRNAEIVVMAEGGAMHVLEITGPIKAKVAVIARRANAVRYERLLREISNDIAIIGHISSGVVLMPFPRKPAALHPLAANLLDLNDACEQLGNFLGANLRKSEDRQLKSDVRLDLINYLLDDRHVSCDATPSVFESAMRHLRDLARIGQI